MTSVLITMIKVLAAILAAIFAGNGAVYCFNKIPAQWLCDYGQQPTEEMLDPYTQRVKSYPWKYIFTMLFVVLNIKMVMDDWQFAIGGLCAIWLLLEMTIADIKYRIIPDQFILLLTVCALGFIPYQGGWKSCLLGAAIGFGVMAATALLGRLAYKRDTLGGGDIKLFTSLGLIMGPVGIVVTLVLTTLISSGHLVYLLASKKIKKTDTVPMVPYIAVAATIYLVFLWGQAEVFFDIFAV
ncbi:MAG: prepilin peptidase [Firmicutes bacterium]|nr:prepilin peptidase [Bacillota bacterium]